MCVTRSVLRRDAGPGGRAVGRRGGRGSQLGLRVGLASVLSLTRHSLDLRLARDLQLGKEAREPQSPSMEGVGSFPAGTERGDRVAGGCGFAPQPCRGGGGTTRGQGPPLREGPGCP